jgi:hypothetical protein
MKHWLMLGLGWGIMVLATVGLFLPIIQGFLLFGVGIIILSSYSPWVRLMVLKLGRRYPKFRRALNATKRQSKRLRSRLRWWKPKT